jgi:hypothetical protein
MNGLWKTLALVVALGVVGFITMSTFSSHSACPTTVPVAPSSGVVCPTPTVCPTSTASRDAPCPLCELPPFKDAFKHLDWVRMKVGGAWTRLLLISIINANKAERDRDGLYSGRSLEDYLHVLARYLAPKLPAPRVVQRPTPLTVVIGGGNVGGCLWVCADNALSGLLQVPLSVDWCAPRTTRQGIWLLCCPLSCENTPLTGV